MRYLAYLFLLVFLSCDREEALTLCDTPDPVKNLPWLQDLTKHVQDNPGQYTSLTISIYEYNGQTIFNIYDLVSSCSFCDLRDCAGNKFSPDDLSDFIANKKNEQMIWCQNPQMC